MLWWQVPGMLPRCAGRKGSRGGDCDSVSWRWGHMAVCPVPSRPSGLVLPERGGSPAPSATLPQALPPAGSSAPSAFAPQNPEPRSVTRVLPAGRGSAAPCLNTEGSR